MSSSGANLHKRLPSETERAQMIPDVEAAQQLRERQRFFEEVFQHDVDVYLSSAHLQIDYKRPPIGSISSMEVNVDMLEQVDLMDISDQEALDVFLSSGGDEALAIVEKEALGDGLSLCIPGVSEAKSRMSSTSSMSSTSDSQVTNEDGLETPTVQSDDEDMHSDTILKMETPPAENGENDQLTFSL